MHNLRGTSGLLSREGAPRPHEEGNTLVCLPGLPACLSVCLSLSVNVPISIYVYTYICIYQSIHLCFDRPTYQPTDPPTSLPTGLPAYLPAAPANLYVANRYRPPPCRPTDLPRPFACLYLPTDRLTFLPAYLPFSSIYLSYLFICLPLPICVSTVSDYLSLDRFVCLSVRPRWFVLSCLCAIFAFRYVPKDCE